jgi:uncharacterized protein YdaU (DUF1376 family)
MSKIKSPAYQWYPKDVLSSLRVNSLTLAEEGAYRRALDFCWLNGSLPIAPKELSKVVGKGCSIKIAEKIKELFTEVDGKLIHDRLENERVKQKEWVEKTSIAGKKSAELRQLKKATNVQLPLEDSCNKNSTLHIASSIAIANNINKEYTGTRILIEGTGEIYEGSAYQFLKEKLPMQYPQLRINYPDISEEEFEKEFNKEFNPKGFKDQRHAMNAAMSLSKKLKEQKLNGNGRFKTNYSKPELSKTIGSGTAKNFNDGHTLGT